MRYLVYQEVECNTSGRSHSELRRCSGRRRRFAGDWGPPFAPISTRRLLQNAEGEGRDMREMVGRSGTNIIRSGRKPIRARLVPTFFNGSLRLHDAIRKNHYRALLLLHDRVDIKFPKRVIHATLAKRKHVREYGARKYFRTLAHLVYRDRLKDGP